VNPNHSPKPKGTPNRAVFNFLWCILGKGYAKFISIQLIET